jgi:hypothetical protein
MSDAEPGDRELLEELRALRVVDVVVQTLTMLSSVGYGKLESGDLDEGRLAIESIRGLLPAVRADLPPELVRDFDQVLANLQLAYAAASPNTAASSGS